MRNGTHTSHVNPECPPPPEAERGPTSVHFRSTDAIDRIARLAARVLKAPFASIFVIEDDRQIVYGSCLPGEEGVLPRSLTARGYGRLVVESGEPLLVEDVRSHPQLSAEAEKQDGGVISIIAVPLGSKHGSDAGVFCVGHPEPSRWSEDDAAILTDLAALAAAEIVRERTAAGPVKSGHEVADAEEQSAAILESITDAFVALDTDWRFTYVNEAAEKLLRFSRSDLLGLSIWSAFPDVAGTRFEDAYRRAVRDGVAVRVEDYFAPLDLWASVHAYPSGEGLSIYFQDISARKLAETRHAAAEAHYRRLVCSIPQAVHVLDGEGCFVEVNPATERILGRSAEELLGVGFDLVISPQSLEGVKELFTDLMSGRANDVEFESFIRRPSGEERLLAITGTSIKENGRFAGVHGIARDVTVEREQQIALRESEERFRQIAEHVKEAFWVCSPDFSTALYISPVYEQISGRPMVGDDVDMRSFIDWVHPDDAEGFREAMKELSHGVATTIEHRIIRPDGTIRRVLVRGFPILDSAGAVYRIVGTAEDVTEERESEARQRLLATALDGLGEGVC
nr:PAS domain S-box protein [Gemmatimonadota bacterium]